MFNLYPTRNLFPCYILSYMYFMLMVTSGISMHAIKPLRELRTDKNIHIVLCQNAFKNLNMYPSILKNKVVRKKQYLHISLGIIFVYHSIIQWIYSVSCIWKHFRINYYSFIQRLNWLCTQKHICKCTYRHVAFLTKWL